MLILEAQVQFDTMENNPTALINDLDTKYIIRPAINFGNGVLFSGNIIPSSDVRILIRGKSYIVLIEMPTVDHESYSSIKNIIAVGSKFSIQNASKIIGSGTIINFIFDK